MRRATSWTAPDGCDARRELRSVTTHPRRLAAVAMLVGLTLWGATGCAVVARADGKKPKRSMIQPDETVVLFPTSATADADGNWRVPLHGWIFEREEDSKWRGGALRLLARMLELDRVAESEGAVSENAIFRRRALWFLSDNERGKRIDLRVGDQAVTVGPSAKNGHFTGELTIGADEVRDHVRAEATPDSPAEPTGDGWIRVHVEGLGEGRQPITGEVLLLAARGLTVISDLDDTIKVTEVNSKRALLRNTFLREFTAVDGMSEAYGRLAARGASFHYLSSSPWQLYPELRRFLDGEGFPRGSIDLQQFRWKDRTFWSLFRSPEERKTAAIEGVLSRYPRRTVILVGDTAERDPEVFAAIARLHPDRVAAIYLRNVTDEPPEHSRWTALFGDLPELRWTVFDDPDAIR